MVKKQVQMIINAGATVVLGTKDIDDVASKYMVEAGIMGVKRCKKSDLERIAKATGGQVLLTLANLEVLRRALVIHEISLILTRFHL